MPDTFTHDVFLSHSAKDRAVARELAGRLKEDGLRVWFEESEDVEEGLEHSRVLVLCLSAHAAGPATRYQIQTEAEEPLITYKTHGIVRLEAQMEIASQAAGLPELPWMAMLGWYLAVMMHNDSAAVAASAGAAG